VGAISGGAAILVTYLSTTAAGLVGIALLLAMLLAIAWLERAPYEKQSRKESALESCYRNSLHGTFLSRPCLVCAEGFVIILFAVCLPACIQVPAWLVTQQF